MKKGKAPLGQNFLTDGYYKNKVLKLIDVKEGESVVEVGAGEGQITEGLLRKGAVVTAIELDPRLAASLREKFGGKVRVIVGDVLKMDFLTPPFSDSTVVSNLPYYITSPFLYKMVGVVRMEEGRLKSSWRGAYITLQKEVAEKITLKDGRAPTRLSALLNLRFLVEPLLSIPRDAFTPQPQVDSVLLRFLPREMLEHSPGDERIFDALLKRVYSRKRRKLKNTLEGFMNLRLEDVRSILGEDDWVLEKRPGELNVYDLARVSYRIWQRVKVERNIGGQRVK